MIDSYFEVENENVPLLKYFSNVLATLVIEFTKFYGEAETEKSLIQYNLKPEEMFRYDVNYSCE